MTIGFRVSPVMTTSIPLQKLLFRFSSKPRYFRGSGWTTGLLYHKTPGYARAKSKKFLFRAKSAAEGYIRGGKGAVERKHLTKAALCDIIMS